METESETDSSPLLIFLHKSGAEDEDVLQASDFDSYRKASERQISDTIKNFL